MDNELLLDLILLRRRIHDLQEGMGLITRIRREAIEHHSVFDVKAVSDGLATAEEGLDHLITTEEAAA